MNIPALRQKIDQLDQRLLGLLNERAELSSSVGRWKQAHQEPVFAPEREEDLLRKLENANCGPLSNSGLRAIYREILSSSRACQKSFSVAFLGAPHSVAWHAVRLRFGVSDRVLPVSSVEELLHVLDRNEAEVALLSRSDLLKAYLPKKGLLRNELGERLFICGDVHLADIPALEADGAMDEPDTSATVAEPAEVSEAHQDSECFLPPADKVRRTVPAPGVEDMFLLLSRRPTPLGPNLKTLVYLRCARGDENLAPLRDLLKTAGLAAKAWDTLPYGDKPGQTCHQLEIEGAVPRQVIEEALRPANRKMLWMEHLGSYPETQVYG